VLDSVYHDFRLAGNKEGINAYLHYLHLSYADFYQPATRFWTFQRIETVLYVVVAFVLLAFTLWWTRRHPR
jgi:hypothetical protein